MVSPISTSPTNTSRGVQPLQCKPWLLNGLSVRLIESHYENNYGGAVRRLAAIDDRLRSIDPAALVPFVLNGLKRDELAARNSAALHELYFASLAFEQASPDERLGAALEASFGSFDRWRSEFMAMANALAGGSGWVVLSWMRDTGELVNHLASDHSQALMGATPILAIDMYEHAYHLDFGANAASYVDVFMRNVDWRTISARYSAASDGTVAPLRHEQEFPGLPCVEPERVQAMLDAGAPLQLADVRPREYVSRTGDRIAAATWYDPERLGEWIETLDRSTPVVAYCAYGHHVGALVTQALRDEGYDVSFMLGGHSAWRALGGETVEHRSSGPDAGVWEP
jgi:superoxide dismutase, Fe-Mn family